MDWNKYPKVYWHCFVSLPGKDKRRPVEAIVNDLTLDELVKKIIVPWKAKRPFVIDSVIAKSPDGIEEVKIVQTDHSLDYYKARHDQLTESSGFVDLATNRRYLPLSRDSGGTDYTAEFLFSDDGTEPSRGMDVSVTQEPPMRTAQLRRMLNAILIADSDLDAFCLDYFPQIKRRFTDGMERTRKLNILLEQVPPEQLIKVLRDYDKERFDKLFQEQSASGSPSVPIPIVSAPTQSPLITDIFRTSGIPERNFVIPNQADELLLRLATMGEGLLVEGPSGVGKTTAVKWALTKLDQLSRAIQLSSLSSRDIESLDRIIKNDFQEGGFLVVDDFHHLDKVRQQQLASLIKLLSDRDRRDAKITLIGINPIGESLTSFISDVYGRFKVVRLNKQPPEKINELIRKGEDAANLNFLQRDQFIAAAEGSFVIAQRLCLEAARRAGISKVPTERIQIKSDVNRILRDVQEDLKSKFGALLGAFAACDEAPPPRGACLTLLWHLSKADNAYVPLHEVRYRDPTLNGAFEWLLSSKLAGFFEKTPRLSNLLYYNKDTAVLSAEDPQLEFFLRHLDWTEFARETGHLHHSWDQDKGLILRQSASQGESKESKAREPNAGNSHSAEAVTAVTSRISPITISPFILHLSDLHFTSPAQVTQWSSQLASDLKYELSCKQLGAVLLSGDIANRATPEEYTYARLFFEALATEFLLTPQQFILVPGNHDVSWTLSEQAYTPVRRKQYKGPLVPGHYIDAGDYIELLNEEDYKKRFSPFAECYQGVRLETYPTEYRDQATIHYLPDLNLLVLGLNSAWEIDHHFTKRASINAESLSRALSEIRRTPAYEKSLKLAVWHHATDGDGEDRIKDIGFLEQLAQAGFRAGLHGHIHKAQNEAYRYYRRMPGGSLELIGAGTFGAPTKEWVPGYPLQYQLLQLTDRKIVVHTRRREEPTGAWKPDARWLQGRGMDPLPRYEIEL